MVATFVKFGSVDLIKFCIVVVVMALDEVDTGPSLEADGEVRARAAPSSEFGAVSIRFHGGFNHCSKADGCG